MASGKLEMGFIFLTQTIVVILGNSFLLFLCNFTLFIGHKLRPTDLILNQLALANSLVLFFKRIPQTMSACRMKYFLGDIGCKLVFYNYRLGTGVSLSTICLLNGFQAIKIDSSMCRWMALKFRSLKFIGFCYFLCWIPHIFLSSCLLRIMSGPVSNQNYTGKNNQEDCSWQMQGIFSPLYAILYFSLDFVCLGYMVLVLHRHKQQVQHFHCHSLSSRCFHEARATCTIMILVSSFFTFYSVYILLTVWTTLVANPGQWTVNTSVLVSLCFPALSLLLLIIHDTHVSPICFVCRVKENWFS